MMESMDLLCVISIQYRFIVRSLRSDEEAIE